MIEIGKVLEVWRYPVSSLGGERVPHVEVSPEGVVGDRLFGLFDGTTGRTASPEQEPRWRPALFLSAQIGKDGMAEIRFPDDSVLRVDDPALDDALAAHFGFPAGIGAYRPGGNGVELRLPIVSNRYTPLPLHLLTTSSLLRLTEVGGFPAIDGRRFRPTLLIETHEGEGFAEANWVGQRLRIGDVEIEVTEPTRRCGMTLVAQPGISEDPAILRTIMRHAARNLGVYACPAQRGAIRVGDTVYAGT